FGMARAGRLPRALARVDAARGVPITAVLSAGTLTLAVAVWAAGRRDRLGGLGSIVHLGALPSFTLLHASVVGYFVWKTRQPARLAHAIVPFLGVLVTVWVIAEASALAKTIGALWLLAGILAAVFLPNERDLADRQRSNRAG